MIDPWLGYFIDYWVFIFSLWSSYFFNQLGLKVNIERFTLERNGKGRGKEKGKGVKIGIRVWMGVDINNDEKIKKVWKKKSIFFNLSIRNIYSYEIILISCILRKMYVIASLELHLIF